MIQPQNMDTVLPFSRLHMRVTFCGVSSRAILAPLERHRSHGSTLKSNGDVGATDFLPHRKKESLAASLNGAGLLLVVKVDLISSSASNALEDKTSQRTEDNRPHPTRPQLSLLEWHRRHVALLAATCRGARPVDEEDGAAGHSSTCAIPVYPQSQPEMASCLCVG